MAKKIQVDTDELEREYVYGTISYAQMAIKYRCSETYIANIAKEKSWYKKRQEHRKNKKDEIEKKVNELLGEEIAAIKTRHYNRIEKLLTLVDKTIEQAEKAAKVGKQLLKPSDLERLTNVISNSQAEQRLCLDVDNDSRRTENDTKRTELAFEKLEIEKKKLFGIDDEELPDDNFEKAAAYDPKDLWKDDENELTE